MSAPSTARLHSSASAPKKTALRLKFPGCDAQRMTWEEVERYEGRIEFWDAASETAWIAREGGPDHAGPSGQLAAMLERIALVRGSPIRAYGATYLMEHDARGLPRRVMMADQTIYLRPRVWKPGGMEILKGRDPLPDVIMEVDHTTDIRRNKLKLYESWGFPELWVEVPNAAARSRPRGLKSGLTIHVLEDGAYVQATHSRALPDWSAGLIHLALNEPELSSLTMRELTRVGRALGESEGTGPDDDLLLGAFRRQARDAGHARGHAEGHAKGREEGWREGQRAGLREGRQEGIEAHLAAQRVLLVRQAARKFDRRTARRVVGRVQGIRDSAALAEVGDWIIDCLSGSELIERLKARNDSEAFDGP